MLTPQPDCLSSSSTRRAFLRTSLLAASAVAWAGCGGDEEIVLADDDGMDEHMDDGSSMGDHTGDDGTGAENDLGGDPGGDPGGEKEPPVDEKPAGVEVKLTAKTKAVGGQQKVDDAATLKALGSGEALLLVRADADTISANTIVCTHQKCEVTYNAGSKLLECPCHGSRFELDGSVNRGPAGKPLKHFKATIHGDSVFLE